MRCPSCGSHNTETVVYRNTKQKDFSAPWACCGYILFGWIGVLCGFCGGENRTNVRTERICRNCGCRF